MCQDTEVFWDAVRLRATSRLWNTLLVGDTVPRHTGRLLDTAMLRNTDRLLDSFRLLILAELQNTGGPWDRVRL
jgi:hypothetical protein